MGPARSVVSDKQLSQVSRIIIEHMFKITEIKTLEILKELEQLHLKLP